MSILPEQSPFPTNSTPVTPSLSTVQIVQPEESEADIGFDLNQPLQQVLEESITRPETPAPQPPLSRRELLKKNWKCLARQSSNANNSDDSGFCRESKLQQFKSHLMVDGRMGLPSVQGDGNSESYHNDVDSLDFLQTQVKGLLQLPPKCKKRRTMTECYNAKFGRMTQGSDSLSFTITFSAPTKRRSKLSRLPRKSGFNMPIIFCGQLLEIADHGYLGCIRSLSPIKVSTKRRTQKRQNHRSISSLYFEHVEEEAIRLPSIHEDLEGNGSHDLHNIPIRVCMRKSNILEPLCTDWHLE